VLKSDCPILSMPCSITVTLWKYIKQFIQYIFKFRLVYEIAEHGSLYINCLFIQYISTVFTPRQFELWSSNEITACGFITGKEFIIVLIINVYNYCWRTCLLTPRLIF
jgi:hypothetical protein